MILEIADLHVVPGHEAEFEAAFAQARAIITAAPGFRALELQRSVEEPSRYALLVRWRTIEDHTEGFRKSPEYERWRKLLHHFYDPSPEVLHYRCIAEA